MKTIRQWFEELPPGYRERALKNANQDLLSKNVMSLRTAVGGGFAWDASPEGIDFWDDVAYGRLPELPDAPPPEDPVKLRAALDAVRAALTECDYGSDFSQGDFDRIVGEVLK